MRRGAFNNQAKPKELDDMSPLSIANQFYAYCDRRARRFVGYWPTTLSAAIILGGGLCGVLSYVILTGLSPIKPTHTVLSALLVTNLVFVTTMVGLVAYQLCILWQKRRRGAAGARLHSRFVSLFSFIAVVPALLVAVFALVTLDKGLDRWFSDRTKAIINNTSLVANAYLDENRENIRNDLVVMASDLNRAAGFYETEEKQFHKFLSAQAALRQFHTALLINREGVVLDIADTRKKVPLPAPPPEAFEAVDNNQPVIITAAGRAQMLGLFKLGNFSNAYLYVMRQVDSRVLEQLQRTSLAVRDYRELEKNRFETQLTFALIYIGITLVILLAAIWLGMWIAKTLATPIGELIVAARKVSGGDLTARVNLPEEDDSELLKLGYIFNEMTERLALQRKELMDAKNDLDLRHQFTQMVLNGVSSGVIGIDGQGRISHANLLAQEIAGKSESDIIGQKVEKIFPYFKDLVDNIEKHRKGDFEIEVKNDTGDIRVLLAKISHGTGNHENDLVLTFDDMTGLLSAKRTAAWADIARRIAHEIKNPLTPIQLSAERLKSKYSKEIATDPDIFRQCTETIIRQVADIGRMVDEFSSFARMPKAVFKEFDLRDALAQTIFLQRVVNSDITYEIKDKIDGDVIFEADRRLFSQAVTNILKNAAEAIHSFESDEAPRIVVTLEQSKKYLSVRIADNGPGLPVEDRNNLVEPYITTHDQGTGLGLAIAKKIMEDHGGELVLEDAPWVAEGKSGAQIILNFPYMGKKAVGKSKVEEIVT